MCTYSLVYINGVYLCSLTCIEKYIIKSVRKSILYLMRSISYESKALSTIINEKYLSMYFLLASFTTYSWSTPMLFFLFLFHFPFIYVLMTNGWFNLAFFLIIHLYFARFQMHNILPLKFFIKSCHIHHSRMITYFGF